MAHENDTTTPSIDSLDTDTVSDVDVGHVLDVGGVTAHAIGTWLPPFLALPEVHCVTTDGYRGLVVADDAVAFVDEFDEDREEWPDDATTATEDVEVSAVDGDELVAAVRKHLDVRETRESPIHPDGNTGGFLGGIRLSDGVTVEFLRDRGYDVVTCDDDKRRDYYGEETVWAFVRDELDTSPAEVPTSTWGPSDDDPVTAEGVYRMEESGRFGALCGVTGKKGWWTPQQIAEFCEGKVGGDADPFGFVEKRIGDKIEWHDRGRNAVVTFTPAE